MIGEAAGHVPEARQAGAPEVRWRQMRALRNLAAHVCFGIDVGAVWETATRNVPALKPLLVPLLQV